MRALDVNTVYSELCDLIGDTKSGFRQRSYPLDNGNMAVVIDYTLSSYQYFKKPSGLLGRGIMFEVDAVGHPVQILSRPMRKFFSYQECPDTMKLNMDVSNILRISDKADGSLMSTWVWNGALRIKSKGSIVSNEVRGTEALLSSDELAPTHQANDAMKQVLGAVATVATAAKQHTYRELAKVLLDVSVRGYTVDMEYLSKESPVVIQYTEDELRVLSINSNSTEAEYTLEDALQVAVVSEEEYRVLKAFQAYPYYDQTCIGQSQEATLRSMSVDGFLAAIEKLKGIEGVIIELKSGQTASRVKFKTPKYLTHTQALTTLTYDHRFPESVYILRDPFAVFAAIVEGYADDLVHATRECPPLAEVVRQMQKDLTPVYNEMVSLVQTFVEQHKHMEKRDFAAASKIQLPPALAAAAMQCLIHGKLDLLSVLRKNKNLLPDLSVYAVSKKDYPANPAQ